MGEWLSGSLTTSPSIAKPVYTQGWEGRRSLKIGVDTDAAEGMVTFRSLGDQPLLVLTVANQPRFRALGWAVGLAVVLAGLAIRGVGAEQVPLPGPGRRPGHAGAAGAQLGRVGRGRQFRGLCRRDRGRVLRVGGHRAGDWAVDPEGKHLGDSEPVPRRPE